MRKQNRVLSFAIACMLGATAACADTWITDAATGCTVWNPNPARHETIVWEGEICDGKANGYGIAVWRVRGRETERAEGQWSAGRLNGYAVWSHANGAGYEGQWLNGARSGCGIYTWPNAMAFMGEYQNDQRTNGRVFMPDGSPQTRVETMLTRELVYQAQDAAILARKAATRAHVETARAKATAEQAEADVVDPSDK
ncbi:MAG: hypothetical protein HN341_05560 [Verrucomicrobia bacterium]|jgi:hypothetical protein|nr:hypothetical protein [Verrucomicrobiota bacterium]